MTSYEDIVIRVQTSQVANSHKGSGWVLSFGLCLLLWGDSVDPRYPEEGWVKRPAPPELSQMGVKGHASSVGCRGNWEVLIPEVS